MHTVEKVPFFFITVFMHMCFFFFQARCSVLPTAGMLTAFYESKHYARTRVGSIYRVVRTLNEFQASRTRLYP